MLIVVLVLATAMVVIWFALLSMIDKEDWIAAAYNKVLDNMTAVEKLQMKDAQNRERLAEFHGIAAKVMKLFYSSNSEKEIARLEEQNRQLQHGNLRGINIFIMPGYVLLRKYDSIGKGSIHKNIHTKYTELVGKKHATNKTKQLMAKLISFPIIGIACSLSLGAIVMGLGEDTMGLLILGGGTLLVMIIVYALYDEVSDQANKRREAISRQFPNVVSKLALLVTSGMIMDRAWKETAYSREEEIYREMQKTSEELDNMVSPEVAYGEFISRCNTKETAKLASAIMQNLSKGNAEIGKLLKDLAKEAWSERRHTAKKDAENANTKLMVPTMLLLLAILVMIMVPVAMNFSAF